MTKEERDDQIYDLLDLCDLTGNSLGVKFRVMKQGVKWVDYLLPDEQKKYDRMSEVEQLQVCLSSDPINAILST